MTEPRWKNRQKRRNKEKKGRSNRVIRGKYNQKDMFLRRRVMMMMSSVIRLVITYWI